MKIQTFQFNLFDVNTYVVWNQATLEAAIVDPGMSTPEEEQELVEFISRNRLQVTALLNTHLHIDHTLGDEFVEERYGVGLEAASADEFLGQNRAAQAQMFHMRMRDPSPLHVDVQVKAGDKIYLGEEYLEALAVPGHSPGSLAFYAPSGGFVITGDALFNGSIGRTDLPGGNHQQLINAIQDSILTLPDATVVYPGHGPSTTVEAEKEGNPFL